MKTLNYDLAANLDFVTKRGDTFNPKPFVVNLVSGSVSQSMDFTGFHAKMQVKHNKSDEKPLLTLSDENGYITLINGSMIINADDNTMNIDPGDHYYDLQITYPNGVVKTWLQGKFKVKQDVTR